MYIYIYTCTYTHALCITNNITSKQQKKPNTHIIIAIVMTRYDILLHDIGHFRSFQYSRSRVSPAVVVTIT